MLVKRSLNYFTAVFWFLLGMFSNVGNDIISKSIELHFFEITFFRFFFASVLLSPILIYRRNKISSFSIQVHVIRGTILFLAIVLWTYGLTITTVTTATTVGSCIPLITLVLSIIFLKEKSTWQRFFVVLIGLLGIFITVSSDSGTFNNKLLILLLSVFLFAILDVINKSIVSKEHILGMLFYSSVTVFVLSFFPMLFYWSTPKNHELLLLVLLGMSSNMVLFFILKAFRLLEIGALTPYRYLEIIISCIGSYIIFREIPQNNVIIGGVVITSSIIFIIRAEHKK